jgi:hypothetical protein
MPGSAYWVEAASIAAYRCIYSNLCIWLRDDRDPGPLYLVPQAYPCRLDAKAELGKVALHRKYRLGVIAAAILGYANASSLMRSWSPMAATTASLKESTSYS